MPSPLQSRMSRCDVSRPNRSCGHRFLACTGGVGASSRGKYSVRGKRRWRAMMSVRVMAHSHRRRTVEAGAGGAGGRAVVDGGFSVGWPATVGVGLESGIGGYSSSLASGRCAASSLSGRTTRHAAATSAGTSHASSSRAPSRKGESARKAGEGVGEGSSGADASWKSSLTSLKTDRPSEICGQEGPQSACRSRSCRCGAREQSDAPRAR